MRATGYLGFSTKMVIFVFSNLDRRLPHKKTIIRAIAIALVFSFFSISSISIGVSAASTTTATTELLNPIALFPFTITPEELLAVLKEHNIKIIYPDPNDWGYDPLSKDGRRIHDHYGSFSYHFEGINFLFSPDEELQEFHVRSDIFATPEGVRVGDSRCIWSAPTRVMP